MGPGARPSQPRGEPSAPKPDAAHCQLQDFRPLRPGLRPEEPSHIFLQVKPDTNAMPLGQMSEFGKLEEDPDPAQGLVEAQLSGAAIPWSLSQDSSSSSSEEEPGPGPEPEVAQPLVQTTLHMKAVHLVAFLLLKYRTQQPTSQAEMLEIVGEDDQDAFPVIFGRASKCMQLVFGVDVKEVDPSDHSYILVPVLGLTWDGMQSGGQGLPKTSLLVVLLGLILLEDEHTPEEEVWEELGVMGVYAGQEHIIYGEPRELLTNVWVQEGYVEYRQVPGSDPARYEFLWGPRAHAETSKWKVTQYFLQLNLEQPASSLALSEGAVRDEEEGA